jgi:basic amino acid/polyamine antiporter, APA family
MAINYISSGGASACTTLVLMTGITSAIPYAFSALAQIKWRIVYRRALHGARFARNMIVAVLALVFSILFIYYSRNTDATGFQYRAPFVLAGVAFLLGVPIYFMQQGKMTQPEPVPEYR